MRDEKRIYRIMANLVLSLRALCLCVAGCHAPGQIVEGPFRLDGKPKPGVVVDCPRTPWLPVA
ncbi:hypothetical protein M3S04_19880 [Xanthomonas sp. PPL139]|uniref:hypothetical protein n=1 Tax=unclassified Xanthomonas TaxID=2643310 RepID=UPI0033A43CF4